LTRRLGNHTVNDSHHTPNNTPSTGSLLRLNFTPVTTAERLGCNPFQRPVVNRMKDGALVPCTRVPEQYELGAPHSVHACSAYCRLWVVTSYHLLTVSLVTTRN
jgi:hypothetical protein